MHFLIYKKTYRKTYKLIDQYLFHTEEALKALTFIEAKEVKI